MATDSSILAWRIPQSEEPGGLQSVGSQRVGWTQLKRLNLHTQTDLKHLLMNITSVDIQMAFMTCDETCLTGWDSAVTWVNNSLLWYLMRRVDSLEKTLMLGGIGGRRRRGRKRMRWLDGITDSMEFVDSR